MPMTPIKTAIGIDAPASSVWPLIAEFRYWPAWGPSVRAVDSQAAVIASGVRGRVQTTIGLWLPFRIERCEREVFWDWSVAGVHATGHRLRPISEERCEVEFSVSRIFLPYVWVLDRGLQRLRSLAEARIQIE
jgi:hypothetical protein